MATRPAMTLHLEQARFDRAMKDFIRNRLPSVVDVVVRKLAFDVMHNTQKAMNGLYGLIKRIDTNRARGGWLVAAQDGGLPTKGLVRASTNTSADGSASWTGTGMKRTVTVANRVEYAAHLEHGTKYMVPGKHLEMGLRRVARALPKDKGPGSVDGEMRKAWNE